MKKEIDEVVDRYAKMIYRIAYIKLKVKTDAEDIVQEVLIKYLLNTKEFENEEHEKNWLIRVTLNLCKNLSGSAWKKHTVPIETIHMELQSEEQERIFEDLSSLKEKYRIVVQLFYYEDLSIESISKILNISESNVRTRLNRARQELKNEIERRDALNG